MVQPFLKFIKISFPKFSRFCKHLENPKKSFRCSMSPYESKRYVFIIIIIIIIIILHENVSFCFHFPENEEQDRKRFKPSYFNEPNLKSPQTNVNLEFHAGKSQVVICNPPKNIMCKVKDKKKGKKHKKDQGKEKGEHRKIKLGN